MEILGLIPARGGSRGLPRKHLALLAGRPLIEYTLVAARASRRLGRTIISTDEPEIASHARQFGVASPFLRPAQLATDDAPILPVIRHALEWLAAFEKYEPDAIALLQPTSPLRRSDHIDGAIELLEHSGADTVVSVIEVPHNMVPEALMIEHNGWLQPLIPGLPPLRRQDKSQYLARNGPAVLITRAAFVSRCTHLYEGRVVGFRMSAIDSVDIDTVADLALAERLLVTQGNNDARSHTSSSSTER